MNSLSALVLLVGLTISPVTMSQKVEQTTVGLEILKASAHVEESQTPGRSRAFTLIVKNTGERVIKSLGFQFDLGVETAVQEAKDLEARNRCGFTLTDLEFRPGDEVTIQRKLSGDHCIPAPAVKQVVRVQEIQYADGTVWTDPAGTESAWRRVKMPRMSSVVTEDGPIQKPEK